MTPKYTLETILRSLFPNTMTHLYVQAHKQGFDMGYDEGHRDAKALYDRPRTATGKFAPRDKVS